MYSIHDQNFTSIKAFTAYVREYINQCPPVVTDGEPFQFFTELLKRHPEDKGTAISFHIIPNPLNPKAKHMYITRTDGTESFSWKKCCGHKSKDAVTEAMRHAISDQIIYFRETTEPRCIQCGKTKDLHVDHIYPFSKIKAAFLQDHIPSEIDYSGFLRDFFPSEFKTKWQEYHKNNATLQILCSTCNCKKGASLKDLDII